MSWFTTSYIAFIKKWRFYELSGETYPVVINANSSQIKQHFVYNSMWATSVNFDTDHLKHQNFFAHVYSMLTQSSFLPHDWPLLF